uniref:NADH dehydrogenase subunit 1 n=1 Tax=Philagra albinotata TaxID=868271 RepID=UPI002551EA4F|nr:NADH dehydrogenase subunit 1 [Philagra albinotata]WGL39482.1 NADH dehydrogenase subunit 1 [Philagra albinotata]
MYIMNILILMMFIMLSIAYFILLERKILGYMQIRKGPNKVGYLGIFQPFSDAIKLFTKEQIVPMMSNYMIYYLSPIFSLFLSLFIWLVFPFMINMINFNYGILFFLCCASMSVYTIMISGWSSWSIYSLLGGLRSVAQTISYEISLSMILLSFILMVESYNFMDFFYFQKKVWFMFLCLPLTMCWLSSSLAETNRTPFDFAESESELVSGFNVEYSSGGFTFFFLGEYSSIIFMSSIFSILFLGCNLMSFIFFLSILMICFMFIWIRGTLPRYRYDKLMYMAWKSYLPISLNYFLFFLGLKMLMS